MIDGISAPFDDISATFDGITAPFDVVSELNSCISKTFPHIANIVDGINNGHDCIFKPHIAINNHNSITNLAGLTSTKWPECIFFVGINELDDNSAINK